MSENVCPVCGDELKVDTIDFATDPSIDPQWLVSNPEYTTAFQVKIKCSKCKKGMVCTFHKPSFSGKDEMVYHAKKIFADAMQTVTECHASGGRRTMSSMSELKPCPFCGGALHIWKQQIKPTIGKVAECDKCGVRISIPWALEEFQAVEFLNRRANDAEI